MHFEGAELRAKRMATWLPNAASLTGYVAGKRGHRRKHRDPSRKRHRMQLCWRSQTRSGGRTRRQRPPIAADAHAMNHARCHAALCATGDRRRHPITTPRRAAASCVRRATPRRTPEPGIAARPRHRGAALGGAKYGSDGRPMPSGSTAHQTRPSCLPWPPAPKSSWLSRGGAADPVRGPQVVEARVVRKHGLEVAAAAGQGRVQRCRNRG